MRFMQGKRLFIASMHVIAISCSTPLFAQDECWGTLGPGGCYSVPFGWFGEGNIGITKFSQASYSGSTSGFSSWSANIGYKFMPFFLLEFGYTSYTNISIQNATGKNNDIHLDVRAILPLGSFELFAKLGVQRIRNHIILQSTALPSPVAPGTNNVVGLYIGVGAQYYLTHNLAVNIQWARAKGNNTTGTLDLWSVGFSFLYGGYSSYVDP